MTRRKVGVERSPLQEVASNAFRKTRKVDSRSGKLNNPLFLKHCLIFIRKKVFAEIGLTELRIYLL